MDRRALDTLHDARTMPSTHCPVAPKDLQWTKTKDQRTRTPVGTRNRHHVQKEDRRPNETIEVPSLK